MRVRRIGVALPPKRVGSEEIAEWTGAKLEFLRDKVGVHERRFLGPEETTSDLAAEACERLFAEAPELDRERLGLLVLVTQGPDQRVPHTSAILQDRLGLGSHCAAFDLALGCSGYVYGLTVAKSFMEAQGIRDALLVTCDPASKALAKTDRDTVAILADAATATWLSADEGARLGTGDFGTDGSGAHHLTVPAGGVARPFVGLYLDEPAPLEEGYFKMNGRPVFNFAMRTVPGTIARCLEANGLAFDDVDFFALHQASRFILDGLVRELGIPEEKMLWNLERLGNTVSSTIPTLIAEGINDGSYAGSRILVCGFGSGLSWGTNVLFA